MKMRSVKMSIIRANDYKEYVAFKKTVDDLYPILPIPAGGYGTGIFTQLAGLFPSQTRPEWLNDFQSLDLEYCMRSGEKWLNKIGAIGLNYDPITHEFSQTTFTDVKKISEMLITKYGNKWDKLYKLSVEEYDPLKNWDATENHDGDWTKNGNESNNKNTSYTGEMSKSKSFGENGHTTKVSYDGDLGNNKKGESTERSYDNYQETKHGGRDIVSSQPTAIGRTYNGYTETNTTLESGGTVDEILKSGFNSGVSGTHPATVNTGTNGGQTVSGTDYVPETLEKITTSDGKNQKTISGTYTDNITIGNGSEEYKQGTYDGIQGSYADTKTGGHTITENGVVNETTSFSQRADNTTGSITYDLDGTKDDNITYSGFFDRMGRACRSDLYVKEWEARMRVFLDEVFKDIDELITLKIY